MRRIYCLLPDVEAVRPIVAELLARGLPEDHLHLLARRGTPLEDLPQAGLAQRSDLIPSLQRGLAAGGATGALAGLLAVAAPPAGLVVGGGAVLGMTLAGAGLGAWMASLLGVSTPNSLLRRFEEAIEQGSVLMMVDAPKDEAARIEALIRAHHPEAEIGGSDRILGPSA